MLKIKCIKKCIYKGRIFTPGEETHVSVDGVFPKQCFIYSRKAPKDLNLPTASGSVTLLGDGPSLQYALDNPDKIVTPVAAINRAGIKWPGQLDYWTSLHAEWFALWRNKRGKLGRNTDMCFISNRVPLNPDVVRSPDHLRTGGGSGLYAAETLILMGFDHIHMIGIDLTGPYEMFRPSWVPENFNIKMTAHDGFLKKLFQTNQCPG